MKKRKNNLIMPVVKWVGGKRQLLSEITPLLPPKFSSYCEPFLGGGALLFFIQPSHAIVGDLNEDLMIVYEVIRDEVDLLIDLLKQHENTPEYFYSIRDQDRDKVSYKAMPKVERASRLIYLNKTCFNGLFRVNSSGEFNSPFGYYKNPNIVNEPVLRAVNRYFNGNDILFCSGDFCDTLQQVKRGGFVYLDPPYDPVSDTSNFTGYNKGGFDQEEQVRLKIACDDLSRRNIRFMLSNSATSFIQKLYSDYHITFVKAKRAINSDSSKRGDVEEVLITNYEIE